MKTLIDVFPGWLSGNGIFSELQSFDVPWKDDDIEDALDREYFGNVSGDKTVSPLIKKMMTGETLSSTERELLATSIMAIYGNNWVKMWATLSFQYDPIENYSMTEQMTDDETVAEYGKTSTRTDNLSHGKTGTETLTPDTTERQTPNLTNATSSDVYGFNSQTAVPTGEQTATATGTNTVTKTGTEQTAYNTVDTDTGTQTVRDGGSDTHTRNYTLTRSGNIGVTTSQQMIESERNLWKWNFFREVVFPDIDKVLATQIYA